MGRLPGEGDTFGRYEVIARIGRGGMGAVFEARQTDLGRSVALKVLSPELADDPGFRDRFTREARMLAALDSPHVIQVLEAGAHDGVLFIATQLVNGRDLGRIVAEDGPLPAQRALKVVAQIASALGDAHDAGLLHRDVKPSNVLVRESRADVFAYLCDFGIARQTVSTHTRTEGVIGTYNYMAPECHTGTDASVASDVYSLGCVLWAALTGRPPYERTSEFQTALAHVHDEIPTYVGESPARGAVNEILGRAMAKDPGARYPTAADMLDAVLVAEMKARGLRPSAAELTTLRGQLAPQAHTVLRPPAAPDPTPTVESPPQRRRTWRVVGLAAASVAAVLALGVAAFGLLAPDDTPSGGEAQQAAEAIPSPSPTQAARSAGVGKAGDRATPERSPQPTPAVTPDAVDPAPGPADPSVTCWDDSTARDAKACPVPSGRSGLETVFPSMDSDCRQAPVLVPGKAEVFECEFGAFMVRYSRWDKGADRYGYLDRFNPGATSRQWIIDGSFAGRQWFSFEDDQAESKQHQWSATYRYSPFSVSVEAVDDESRAVGIAAVVATDPQRVGLR